MPALALESVATAMGTIDANQDGEPQAGGESSDPASGLPVATIEELPTPVSVPVPAAVPALAPTPVLTAAPVSAGTVPFAGAARDRTAETASPQTAVTAPGAPAAVTLVAADLPVAASGERSTMPGLPSAAMPRAAQSPALDLQSVAGAVDQAVTIPAAPQAQPLAMQDLTQIVERLAAAREAVAPVSTQLAVDHADFGPLSLSIEQGRGGELAIQVAAADTDSQAALVAAMAGADLPHFDSAPDRRESPPERESARPGGEGRGQQQGRDGFAGQPHSRFDQSRREQQQQPVGHGEARSGTYA
ncbi:hypothetical protein V5740_07085 [Croceibacterium sp. TMG7-5b_MA50]|uniref:hypothetical protein n=1 Tax=Croceibacterium sp. TMG7-5b_MA50 TaxID=3121290 RepID=UPI003221C996